MLNWTAWNRTVYMYKMDLALTNLQWLMCHKTKPNQTSNLPLQRIFLLPLARVLLPNTSSYSLSSQNILLSLSLSLSYSPPKHHNLLSLSLISFSPSYPPPQHHILLLISSSSSSYPPLPQQRILLLLLLLLFSSSSSPYYPLLLHHLLHFILQILFQQNSQNHKRIKSKCQNPSPTFVIRWEFFLLPLASTEEINKKN